MKYLHIEGCQDSVVYFLCSVMMVIFSLPEYELEVGEAALIQITTPVKLSKLVSCERIKLKKHPDVNVTESSVLHCL